MTEFFRFRKLSVDRLYELLLHGLQRRDLCRLFNQLGGVLRFQNILAQSDNAVPAQNKGTQLRIGPESSLEQRRVDRAHVGARNVEYGNVISDLQLHMERHKFFKITLPMLTPTIFFNLINQLINGFMAFTQSYIITQGKPRDTTLFYTVYMYQNAFTYNKLGYGCALAWFMILVVGILTLILFKTQNKWVYYESEG